MPSSISADTAQFFIVLSLKHKDAHKLRWFVTKPHQANICAVFSAPNIKTFRPTRQDGKQKNVVSKDFLQLIIRLQFSKVAHVISFTPPMQSLVNMSVCRDWIHSVFMGQKAHRIPPKTGRSKLSLWAGCEVRVIGLKTVSTVPSQPATIGATYQRIPLGRDWINPPPRLINWNQWMGCQEEERGGGGGGEKVGSCEMKGGIDGRPEARGHLQVISVYTWAGRESEVHLKEMFVFWWSNFLTPHFIIRVRELILWNYMKARRKSPHEV